MAKRAFLKMVWIISFVFVAPTAAGAADQPQGDEGVCRIVEFAARAHRLPVAALTKLLWYESRFQVGAVSRAGALGIAQFMPATANERGLRDPFDLDLAIPHAANLLAELEQRFGNIGLAIAAYNAGPSRVASWLDKTGSLPRETSRFVLAITGRRAEEWEAFGPNIGLPSAAEPQSCIDLRIFLRRVSSYDLEPDRSHLMPGIELSGRPLPGMKQKGQPLPVLQQSGRLLPGIGLSGRPVP